MDATTSMDRVDPGVGRKRNGISTLLLSGLWLAGVAGSMVALAIWSSSPGTSQPAPEHWPGASVLRPDGQLPTLLMFAHPRCPCTRASIGELALLMTQGQGKLKAHLFFICPTGMDSHWAETDSWKYASTIPGVTVHLDREGTEADCFHATTSGQTLLYDTFGSLVFQGGITLARGHSGDNPGRDTIIALVHRQDRFRKTTPVFGCQLSDKECRMKAP